MTILSFSTHDVVAEEDRHENLAWRSCREKEKSCWHMFIQNQGHTNASKSIFDLRLQEVYALSTKKEIDLAMVYGLFFCIR